MNFRIEVICVRDDGTEERREMMTVSQRTAGDGNARVNTGRRQGTIGDRAGRMWSNSRRRPTWSNTVSALSVAGSTSAKGRAGAQCIPSLAQSPCPIRVGSGACAKTSGSQTFRPTAQWLTGHTSPELLYLETKWASLIPYAKVADLLKDVLPSRLDVESRNGPQACPGDGPPGWNRPWAKSRTACLKGRRTTGRPNPYRMDR